MIRAEAGAAHAAARAVAASAARDPLWVGRIRAFNTTRPPGLRAGSDLLDVDGLRPLVALLLVEGDLRALGE